jgi:5'-nucleotidase
MRILLTNDDGVHAPGLLAIYNEIKALGEVTVVAPDSERSSTGQAITLNHPVYHKVVSVAGRFKAHALSGTPTDCVKFAVAVVLKRKPDLIVSGINRGSNDGCSVFYSGTVSAAREGALMGIPSVALSLDSYDDPDYKPAAKVCSRIIRWAVRARMPKGTFLNVNVPDVPESKMRGIRFSEQCLIPIHGVFRRRKDPSGRSYYWLTGRPRATRQQAKSDTFALQENFVTVVPIHCDGTDHGFLKTINKKGERP